MRKHDSNLKLIKAGQYGMERHAGYGLEQPIKTDTVSLIERQMGFGENIGHTAYLSNFTKEYLFQVTQ